MHTAAVVIPISSLFPADVPAFLSGETAKGSPPKPGGGASGEDANSYYCMNFPMAFIDNIDSERVDKQDSVINPKRPGPFSNDTVVVAVFDSGVDPDVISQQLYHSDNVSCMGDAANSGWNFVADNNQWQDDFPKRHGTVVSKLIIDQAYKAADTYVKILPVKVHNQAGTSHLSDILCALKYAKDRGANIINASFGFYAPINSAGVDTAATGALLFREFLKTYFADSNILMVAAAGNIDPVNESYVYQSTDPDALRNLDSVNFFPASFSRYFPNVIAVTTVSENFSGKVSPHQNFSKNVVDVGVNADGVFGANYVFVHPSHLDSTVQGSSFAAPIVTGKLAAHYGLIKSLLSGGTVDKNAIISKLFDNGLLHDGNAYFQDRIKNGKIMNK